MNTMDRNQIVQVFRLAQQQMSDSNSHTKDGVEIDGEWSSRAERVELTATWLAEFVARVINDSMPEYGRAMYPVDCDSLVLFSDKHLEEWEKGFRCGVDSTDEPAWPENCADDYIRIIGPVWNLVEATA